MSNSDETTDPFVCSRCFLCFPFVYIVKCQKNPVIGGLVLCVKCHRCLHPDCGCITTLSETRNVKCYICLRRLAQVVCPQCAVKRDGKDEVAIFCGRCNEEYHVNHKFAHLDHVIPLPQP